MITTNPGIMHGEPCIEHTRITVSAILHLLAQGASDGQIVEAYAPQITPQDLADVRAWWASPEGMRWALARLHGGTTRTVIAMVQRLLGGESIESVASDYDLDGEPIDPEALRGDLGGIEVLLADRRERDEALALAEERRVKLMLAGLERAPDGWVTAHHGTAFDLTWCFGQHLSGFVTFVIDSEGVRTIAKLHEPRDYRRRFFKTAVNAWTHAQALRAHIEQHGELPKEPQ